jgi:hypothetical protein
MEVSSENHLFQWAIYTMAMLNNQRVYYKYGKMMRHNPKFDGKPELVPLELEP